MPSFKVTGDAFIEVNHDKLFDNVPNGFKFLPTELMGYDYNAGAWCIRNTGHIFEPENLIHIYEPKIQIRGSKWGTSLIDTIAQNITFEVLGMNHNKDIFENHGLDPRGVISFDRDLKPQQVKDNILRLKKQKNKKGVISGQGLTYQQTNNSNKDMEFLDDIQIEMATARSFIFSVKCKNKNAEQVFQTANDIEKTISGEGFDVGRMGKEDIKRILALYFGASLSGDLLPDVDGLQYVK